MKVLNGMSEVAGQGIYTVQGLIANGVPANMAVWSRNTNGYETDIDLRIDKKQNCISILCYKNANFCIKSRL